MNFETIKKYFDSKLWNERMVANAVKKGIITKEEYTIITNKELEG